MRINIYSQELTDEVEAGWSAERHVLNSVASLIDHPSVYMGGPSRDARRKAKEIVEFFRTDKFATQAAAPTPNGEGVADADVEKAGRAMFELEWFPSGDLPEDEWKSTRDYWMTHARAALEAVRAGDGR